MTDRFRKLTATKPGRLILSVEGMEKEGKTHFALTAPGPIALFNIDKGTEGVVEKFLPFKDVFAVDYPSRRDETQADYDANWAQFLEDYYAALDSGHYRTLIIDTATELWEMIRLCRLQKLTQVMPQDYAPVNREFRGLIDAAFHSDKNLILLHKMKKLYAGRDWSGNYERAGFSETAFIVQGVLRSFIDIDDDGEQQFYLRVVKCRQNALLNDEVYEGELGTFPWLATFIYPETDITDWE